MSLQTSQNLFSNIQIFASARLVRQPPRSFVKVENRKTANPKYACHPKRDHGPTLLPTDSNRQHPYPGRWLFAEYPRVGGSARPFHTGWRQLEDRQFRDLRREPDHFLCDLHPLSRLQISPTLGDALQDPRPFDHLPAHRRNLHPLYPDLPPGALGLDPVRRGVGTDGAGDPVQDRSSSTASRSWVRCSTSAWAG